MPSVEEPLGTPDGRSEALFVHSMRVSRAQREHDRTRTTCSSPRRRRRSAVRPALGRTASSQLVGRNAAVGRRSEERRADRAVLEVIDALEVAEYRVVRIVVRKNAVDAGDADAEREVRPQPRRQIVLACALSLGVAEIHPEVPERLLRARTAAQVEESPVTRLGRVLQSLQRRRDANAVESERRAAEGQCEYEQRTKRAKTMLHVLPLSLS